MLCRRMGIFKVLNGQFKKQFDPSTMQVSSLLTQYDQLVYIHCIKIDRFFFDPCVVFIRKVDYSVKTQAK